LTALHSVEVVKVCFGVVNPGEGEGLKITVRGTANSFVRAFVEQREGHKIAVRGTANSLILAF
jgi:hypothetical protein